MFKQIFVLYSLVMLIALGDAHKFQQENLEKLTLAKQLISENITLAEVAIKITSVGLEKVGISFFEHNNKIFDEIDNLIKQHKKNSTCITPVIKVVITMNHYLTEYEKECNFNEVASLNEVIKSLKRFPVLIDQSPSLCAVYEDAEGCLEMFIHDINIKIDSNTKILNEKPGEIMNDSVNCLVYNSGKILKYYEQIKNMLYECVTN